MKSYQSIFFYLVVCLSFISVYAQADNGVSRANGNLSADTTGTLKQAFDGSFLIGVAVNQRNISDSVQAALVCKEFNSITAENDMKPQSTHPAEDRFDWDGADRIADFCRNKGIRLRGHCLVWHNQIGPWMFTDNSGNEVSKDLLLKRIREHVHAVVKRYKDIVYCWDVVNEAVTDDAHATSPYRQSRLYKIAGDDFIREAFKAAREADPEALLFYNDYNECDPVKSERIAEMVRNMKAEGVPIDGIGMQGHYNIYGPSAQEVDAAINKYRQIVKHIHVTELDVRVNHEMGGQLRHSRQNEQLDEVKVQLQQKQYASLFNVFDKHKDVIDCVTFWNLSDRDSWLGADNSPLLFDKNYRRKAVYDIVRKHILPQDIVVGEASGEGKSTARLTGKVMNVIGDSYVRNHRRPFTETWHYKVAMKLGLKYNNYGRNGSSIAFDRSKEGFGKSILQRYNEMADTADYILVIAGHNDADKIKNSRDSLKMFRDSLEQLCRGLINKYPSSKIAFVTPWNVPRAGFKQVTDVILEVCKSHHIPVLNAAATSGIRVEDEQFRRKYFQGINDTAHLNDEGHNLLTDWGESFILGL